MIPFTFIHTADLHLDSLFTGMNGLSDKVRHAMRESTFGALDQLVNLALDQKVDFVVVSGDVYDAADSSLQAQLRFYEALDVLGSHGIHTYIIHGNHDPLDSPRIMIRERDYVHVFGRDFARCTATRRDDRKPVAVIGGISYPTAKVTNNMALEFVRDKDSSLFHIALLHANLDGNPAHETYSPCTRRDLVEAGYDYWALGHIHTRAVLAESPYIVYPGNIQGRSIKETGARGCYVVSVGEDGTADLSFYALDRVRWFREEISISGIEREEDFSLILDERIDVIRKQKPGRMSIVRFNITGRSHLHRQLANGRVVDELLQELRRRALKDAEAGSFEGLVWVEGMSVQSGPAIDREALQQEDIFLGELLRYEAASADDADLKDDILQAALALLMGNRELRKLLGEASEEEKADWIHRAGELAAVMLLDQGTDEGGGE